MCIRDSTEGDRMAEGAVVRTVGELMSAPVVTAEPAETVACLLYTSDAADERSRGDLGGRRIIKKKNTHKDHGRRASM